MELSAIIGEKCHEIIIEEKDKNTGNDITAKK